MKIRFDDICVNSNMRLAVEMAEHIKDVMPEAEIIFSISPLVHNMSGQGIIDSQRVYPKIFNAKSDHTIFYKPEKLGIPEIFTPSDKPKMPIVTIHTREPRETMKIVKSFYVKQIP